MTKEQEKECVANMSRLDEQIVRLPTYEKLENRQPAPEKVSFFKF